MASTKVSPAVSVIIVNYMDKDHIAKCLESLRQTQWHDFEVIVVDQLTPDFEEIESRFHEVRLLHLDTHVGPAAARNHGVALARGPLLVFLDNDTVVEPDWLSRLIEPLESDPIIAAAQSKLLQMSNPRVIDSIGDFIDRQGFGYSLGQGEVDEGQYDDAREIFSPRTACAIVRKSIFEEVGGFDEDFHVDWEDVDLGWRIRLLGYRIVSAPLSRVHHFVGGTKRRTAYHIPKNTITLIVKNYSTPYLLRCLPSLVGWWLSTIFFVRRASHTLAVLRGLVWPLIHFRAVWKKRIAIQEKRKIGDRELSQLMWPPRRNTLLALGQLLVAAFLAMPHRLRGSHSVQGG